MKKRIHRNLRRAAFTLIELLVVMAITTILLGLIFGPMLQSFNLTNRARIQVLSQDTARNIMDFVYRETANGVFMFDNANQPIFIWARDRNGLSQPILLPYAMIDMVPPARVKDQNVQVAPIDIDPTTGLALDRGDISLPLAPGRVMIRYWLGLKDNASSPHNVQNGQPATPYGNFFENTTDQYVNSARLHNPTLLYRAEVSPYLPNLNAAGQVQVDRRLFDVDANGNPALYDPNFFYDNRAAGTVELPGGVTTNRVDGWKDDNGDVVVNIAENWKAIARAMVPTDRADEVVIQRDSQKNVIYDAATDLPRIIPQVRIQPTYVGNDAGAPSSMADAANESPTALPPSSYAEAYGAWTLPFRLYVFRSANPPTNPLSQSLLTYYFANGNGSIYYQTYDIPTGTLGFADPGQLTDWVLGQYVEPTDKERYAALQPNRRPQIMFTTDTRRGMSNFALPDWIVLHDGAGNKYDSSQRSLLYGDGTRYSALGSDFYAQEPNQRFAAMQAAGQNPYRMISLASLDDPIVVPPLPRLNSETAAAGPRPPLELQPDGRTWIPNVQIVPGSEKVTGPDMKPGPHYGRQITYTRVPRNSDPLNIGPNEYMINYTNLAVGAGTPMELRAGTIIFDSNPNAPNQPPRHDLPTQVYGPAGALVAPGAVISITYQIQNNLPSDIVKGDYLTRQLMTLALGVRLFDFNSGQPQQVTLTQKIRVRNLQR